MKSSISESKKCTKCGVERPLTEFYKKKREKDGYSYHCKACCRDYGKKWRKDNLEKVREARRAYYYKNKEKESAYAKKWKQSNRERWSDYNREYYQNNPHVHRALNAKKRARIKEAAVDLTDNERLAIRLIYEDAQILGWHVDHIVPLSKGGLHHPDNLQIVSPSYNLQKKDRIYNTRKYL